MLGAQGLEQLQDLGLVGQDLEDVKRQLTCPYGLLLVTGLAMVFVGGLSLTTPWILVALVLFVALALTGDPADLLELARDVNPAAPFARLQAALG